MLFFCEGSGAHRDLHVLSHSFPTRRSSDLAFIDQHLELLLFLLSGGKIVDRKRLKDSNRLHCLVKLATLLATFRRFDCRLNLIEIDLPKSPAREVGLEQIDVTQGSHHVRSEEHTSELQSLMRISYAVFCLKKNIN